MQNRAKQSKRNQKSICYITTLYIWCVIKLKIMFKFSPFDTLKVKDLYEICKEAIDEGYGEKDVYLNFNDCEEYHPLHYGFSPISNSKNINIAGIIIDIDNAIALGWKVKF